jgi:hypothetical protein|nr:MAG TPA: hypothetical protein [Caudoviricetes sp.]
MNNCKVVNFEKEIKRANFKRKIKSKINDAKEFVIRNKEELIVIVPVVITGTATIVKVVGKRINLHKQESVKNLYCYDRSLGHYWRLRRELSNREWLEIDNRKRNGERLSEILDEMKVLK